MRRLAPVLAALALGLAGCGGGEESAPLPENVEGTVAREQPPPQGDPAAGKPVFASQGCGSCHTFEAAGSNASIGPNLDESLEGKDAEYVREGIVAPDAEIAEGFSAGIMPKDYEQKLSAKQISDLVAFLTQQR